MMNKTIKHMDIKEFREQGFLQEANRLYFHPLGLALEVRINDIKIEVKSAIIYTGTVILGVCVGSKVGLLVGLIARSPVWTGIFVVSCLISVFLCLIVYIVERKNNNDYYDSKFKKNITIDLGEKQ